MEWAKSNIKLGFETFFVDINNATTDYEDLRLMYSCKYNIIANSTFSWWGAFLNQNEDKIVIAPEKWYNDKNNEISFEDFIPQDWIRM
ncbi:MAG: alpha-1,2-fucosyltransferase [Saprospiraceae bacterium]|nr:alpha-1,2-fucosyltransferase [Saprospiraceae bacterium]